jgi:glycosyltransferase involved in cell wall biosynthesis
MPDFKHPLNEKMNSSKNAHNKPGPPIRVLHIITRLILGGAQENTLFTVEGLHRSPRWEVALATGPAIGPEGELVNRARQGGLRLFIIDEMRREINPWRDFLTLIKLLRLIRSMRPEVVHTHSSKAGILGRLAARLLKVPVIIHTIHGLPFHPYQGRLHNWLFIGLEKMAARWTDKLICVADAMRDQAVAAGVAAPAKFITIYSGMEVADFLKESDEGQKVRQDLGIPLDALVVGKIARLFPLKGYEYVLQAIPQVLAKFPQVRLLFVGDGILREALEKEARQGGFAQNVIFAGLVDPQKIPAYLKAMDVVVHASLREGLARVLPQALISGKPVVSYDVDGAREVVLPGKTGWLIPPKSIDELARAIKEALSHPDEARKMGATGRSLFTEKFRSEVMVERIARLYQELLAIYHTSEFRP